MLTYIFAVTTVPTEASQTAVDHLDAAEHQLNQAHGQQDGEQDDMPHHCIFGILTDTPQSLIYKVAALIPARENSNRA